MYIILRNKKLQDFSVSDGVGEDVPLPQAAVVMGTGLTLTEPGHDAGVAEPEEPHEDKPQTSFLPVSTAGLVRIPQAQEADRALVLRVKTRQKF